jgi:hypothetical protein
MATPQLNEAFQMLQSNTCYHTSRGACVVIPSDTYACNFGVVHEHGVLHSRLVLRCRHMQWSCGETKRLLPNP